MDEPKAEVAVQSLAVDTHCHLFLLDEEPSVVLERARRAGVGRIVCPGIDPGSSRRSLDLAGALPGVYATAGMHPHDAAGFDRQARAEIERLLTHPRVVAVGECGLDLFRMRSPRDDQERAFRSQIAMATEAGLPLVVHVRDAWEPILRLLDEGSAERVVLHCFTGDAETAVACAARGWHLSFAGNITYPKNDGIREAAGRVELDRVLVETDSPFLSPQRIRGRANEPANVVDVIAAIAQIRGQTVENVRTATARNAEIAFPRLRTTPNGRSE